MGPGAETGTLPGSKLSQSSATLSAGGGASQTLRKRDFITKTLSKDYPGLDYLGFHNVLNAKNSWYRALWFTIVTVCLIIGLYTIYRILVEYIGNPSATLISVKSVEKLLLPQLTVCATHAGTINLARVEGTLFHNRIPNYTQTDLLNFAYFMLAGSGFQKMKSRRFDSMETCAKMAAFYDTFRGNKSIEEFFRYFMDSFGLQCHEFLQDCRLGDQNLDCCKVFVPEYLMRRGRCFRTVALFQSSYDELGKLRVSLRQPFSMDPSMPIDEEVLAFLAEHKEQIAPFPRYYLYPDTWTKARISAKRISLFPAEEVCSEENRALSKDVCYIQQWIRSKLEQPYNCTYPYMHKVRNVSLQSCHPSIILDSYENTVEATSYTMHSCVLACERWEYSVAVERTPANVILKNGKNLEFTYRIDVSYNDLQYEEIREVSTVTLVGLIAQIGGQLSLFMGSSILNLTQILIMIVILTRRAMRKRRKRLVTPDDLDYVYAARSGISPAYKFDNAAFNGTPRVERVASPQPALRELTTGSRAAHEFLKTQPGGDATTPSMANSSSTASASLPPPSIDGRVRHVGAQRRSRRRAPHAKNQDSIHSTTNGVRKSARKASPSFSSTSPRPALPPHYDIAVKYINSNTSK